MKRVITINYSWRGDVPQRHVESLEEDALERITKMLKQGYSSGELNTMVLLSEDDGDGVEYRGWWESKTTKPSPEK